MPPKRLKHNQGLPRRWRFLHNAYYYAVPPGLEHKWGGKKLFKLGRSLNDAYRVWADHIGYHDDANTVAQLLERYTLEHVTSLTPQTQTGYKKAIRNLNSAIGHYKLTEVTPQEVYTYIRKRTAKIAARREKAVLSHAFTKAVEWGYIASHPFKGEVRLEGEKARERYIEDWEIDEIMKLKPRRKKGDLVPMFQAYIKIKNLIGLRKINMLRLKVTEFTDKGIPSQIVKKRKPKKVIFEWTDELRAAVEEAKAARPVHISPYLFCNRRGKSYVNEQNHTMSGFDTSWARFIGRVMTETSITEHFTEHDLRAKASSDSEDDDSAQKLMVHDSKTTTRKHYRRKEEVVRPLR